MGSDGGEGVDGGEDVEGCFDACDWVDDEWAFAVFLADLASVGMELHVVDHSAEGCGVVVGLVGSVDEVEEHFALLEVEFFDAESFCGWA